MSAISKYNYILVALVAIAFGSTVNGQDYDQYGYPCPPCPVHSPCPPCPIHAPCPPCPPQYYPTYPVPYWGRGYVPSAPYFTSPEGYPAAGQTTHIPFSPRTEGPGGYTGGGYSGYGQGSYDNNRQDYTGQTNSKTAGTGGAGLDSRPNGGSDVSGASTDSSQNNFQTNLDSSQGNGSTDFEFGNAAQAGITTPTGSAVPNMIGDSASIPTRMLTHTYWTMETVQYPNPNYVPGWQGDPYADENQPYLYRDQSVSHQETVPFSSTPSMFITMLNMAENFNAEVQDRIYLDLRFFGGAQGYGASTDWNDDRVPTSDLARATMGFEKSFFRRRCSLELRLPVVMNLNSSNHDPSTIGSTRGNQLGNISLIFKHAFHQSRNYTLSRGFGINLPTAPGMHMTFRGGQTEPVEAYIDNGKTSLVPFFGMQWHPDQSRNFGHAVAQLDIALGTNRLRFYDTSLSGEREEYRISLNESTLARLNFGVGHWLIQRETDSSRFKLGVMAECHYTANLDKLSSRNIFSNDRANQNYFTASATNGGWQMINLVFGIPIQTQHSSFMAFVTTPITNTRYFDVEGGLTYDVRF